MDRRQFLSVASVTMLPLAGCSELRSQVSTESTTDSSGPAFVMSSDPTGKYDEPEQLTGDSGNGPKEYMDITVEIGDREDSQSTKSSRQHGIVIWNAAAKPRFFETQLVDDQAGEVVMHEIHKIVGDTALPLSLNEPSDYILNLFAFKSDVGATVNIPQSQFDCNESTTTIKGGDSSSIRSRTTTTLAQCK